MSFLTFYLLCVLFALVNIVFISWWELRREPNSSITLSEVLIGLLLVSVPAINFIVWVVSMFYIVDHIGTEIVIFGKKK